MTIIFLGIAWLAVFWLASVVELPIWLWTTLRALSIASTLFRRQVAAGMYLAMVGVFCLDASHLVSAETVIHGNYIAYYNGREAVSDTGVGVDEPEIRNRAIEQKVKSEAIERQDGGDWPVTGILLVTGPGYPAVPFRAEVRVTGRLQEPENPPQFCLYICGLKEIKWLVCKK